MDLTTPGNFGLGIGHDKDVTVGGGVGIGWEQNSRLKHFESVV